MEHQQLFCLNILLLAKNAFFGGGLTKYLEIVRNFEKKLDELKLIRIGTNNDDKRAEEKLMEKMLSNQRKRVHKYQVWR